MGLKKTFDILKFHGKKSCFNCVRFNEPKNIKCYTCSRKYKNWEWNKDQRTINQIYHSLIKL